MVSSCDFISILSCKTHELNLNSTGTQRFAFSQVWELFHYAKNIPELFQWSIFDALG